MRLQNSIVKAEADGTLPFKTVGDYLDAGPQAIPHLLASVRNFGCKTATELDRLVHALGESNQPCLAEPSTKTLFDWAALKTSLIQLFRNVETQSAMADQAVPTRLVNALNQSGHANQPLSELLSQLGTINRDLPRMHNVGRRFLRALHDTLGVIVDTQFARIGLVPAHASEARAFLLDGTELSDCAAEALFNQLNEIASLPSGLDIIPETVLPPEIILREAVGNLRERDREVIQRRFGLNGRQRETLEEIGIEFGRTRERIRQIEAKAIKSLRPRTKNQLELAVFAHAVEAWNDLSNGKMVLSQFDLQDAAKHLSPWFELALEICRLSLVAWLDAYAQEVPSGWIAPTVCKTRFCDVAAELNDRLTQRSLPVALRELVAPEHIVEAAAVICLRQDLQLYRGYVVDDMIGRRLRRALGLHELLTRVSAPLDIVEYSTILYRVSRRRLLYPRCRHRYAATTASLYRGSRGHLERSWHLRRRRF